MNFVRRTLPAVLLLCASAGVRADAIDPALKRKILAGWMELERADGTRSAIDQSSIRNELAGPRKGITTGNMCFRRTNDCVQVSSKFDRGMEIVRNSRYAFLLVRESKDLPWTLRSIELEPESENAKKLLSAALTPSNISPTAEVILGPFENNYRFPSALSEDSAFQMTKAETLPDGLVVVHYTYAPLLSGELDCDPTANYFIRRGRCHYHTDKGHYDLTFERQFTRLGTDGQIAVEHKVHEVKSSLGLHFTRDTTFSYPDVSKSGELDEERFRLTAYGLPEPEGVVWEKPRNWKPFWLVGAGALIVLLATAVLWRMRRGRREVKPT